MKNVSDKHRILIVEDDADNAATMSDIVRSMGFDCRVVATLDEVAAAFDEYAPCAVLQDMQIPHAAGARPHEKAGETSIRLVRERSNGKTRVPIVVVTAWRSDPDFVWEISELECDGFVTKGKIEALGGKLGVALGKTGRGEHGNCDACNAASAPKRAGSRAGAGGDDSDGDAGALHVATLYAHDRYGVGIDESELRAIVAKRAEYDLFLDAVTEDARGWRAGKRDYDGAFQETWVGEMSAGILLELVEAKRALRADGMKKLRLSGHQSAVRLVQKARLAVDVHLRVGGKESRTEWRSIKTVGEKGALGFEFAPGTGVKFGVIGRRGRR